MTSNILWSAVGSGGVFDAAKPIRLLPFTADNGHSVPATAAVHIKYTVTARVWYDGAVLAFNTVHNQSPNEIP